MIVFGFVSLRVRPSVCMFICLSCHPFNVIGIGSLVAQSVGCLFGRSFDSSVSFLVSAEIVLNVCYSRCNRGNNNELATTMQSTSSLRTTSTKTTTTTST